MDISGSMHYNDIDCISIAEMSCAISMIMKYVDNSINIMGFSSNFVELKIDPYRRLDDNLQTIQNLPFGNTDISLPFLWALKNNKKYDAFIVLTDNETNSNQMKPIDALKIYREQMQNPKCKLVVIAMTATSFSIADPNDKYMLDIAGFDINVPDIINDFIIDN